MGLFDNFNSSMSDPQTMGLLGMAGGLLQASGPSRMPVSFGQALGSGMQGAVQGTQQAYGMQQQAFNNAMMRYRMNLMQNNPWFRSQAADSNAPSAPSAPPPVPQLPTAPLSVPGLSLPGKPFVVDAPTVSAPQQSPQPQGQPQGGGMFGVSPGDAFQYGMMMTQVGDPSGPELMKSALGFIAPTDFVKTLSAAGIDPSSQLGRQLVQQNLAKQNYIAPTRLGEGAYFDPSRGVQGLPSQAPAGYMNVQDENGQWSTVPVNGGVQAAANSAGAIKGAQSANSIINVKTASGAEVPMWAGTAAGRGAGMPGLPPARAQVSQPQTPHNGAANGAAQNTQSDPWKNIPLWKQPSGIGQSTYQQKLEESAAAQANDLYTTLGQNARDADDRMAFNNQALAMVDKADSGTLSDLLTYAKTALVTAGVPEQDFTNNPAANTALNKDLVNAALQRGRKIFGARFTQSEVGIMLNRAAPSADMTKTAMKFLLSTDNAQLQYQKQMSSDYAEYMNRGGDPRQFQTWYSQNFPLSKQIENVDMNQFMPGGSGGTANPAIPFSQDQLNAELKRRGM